MRRATEGAATRTVMTARRVWFGMLASTAFVVGYVGIWQYVHTERGSAYGRQPWDIAYYDLQLFVLSSNPLQGPSPYNPFLEVARYLAAAATVYALFLAASALFGDTWRRWRRRRMRGHAIVVGDTPEARAVAAKRAKTMRVLEIDRGDLASLRGAGIAGADVVYACEYDRGDIATNVATALAAASLRRGGNLRINVQVTDPTLALGLKARRLMKDNEHEPTIDFFSIDEMAARKYVESDELPGPGTVHILVAGGGVFGQAVLVEFARQWRQRHGVGAGRVAVTLVDPTANEAAELLLDRWPALRDVCDIEPVTGPINDLLRFDRLRTPYRAYFCHEDEELALSTALSAVSLWRGGTNSVVVRLSALARHGAAFQGTQVLLDNLGGRLHVVNVAEVGSDLVVQDRDPVRDLAADVHGCYLTSQSAAGVEMGSSPAMRPWSELPEDLRRSNRAVARDFPAKLSRIGCTVAPRSARMGRITLTPDEIEVLAKHEHKRWMAERHHQRWRKGKQRDDRRKIHDDLVPWEELSEESRNNDRDAARNVETIFQDALAEVGLQIVRLNPASSDEHSDALTQALT